MFFQITNVRLYAKIPSNQLELKKDFVNMISTIWYGSLYFHVYVMFCRPFVNPSVSHSYGKACLKRSLKNKGEVLMTNGSLKVVRIAECPPWSIVQNF